MPHKRIFRRDTLAAMMFAGVFLDSFLSYFSIRFGFSQVALFPFSLYITYMLLNGPSRTFPSVNLILILLFLVLGLLMGAINVSSIGITRIPEIISALIAFGVGYRFFAILSKDDDLWWFFFLLSGAYILTCTAALLQVFPHLFPIHSRLWSDGVSLHARPEIMTDQNFQIFYLFPILLTMIFAKTYFRIIASFVLMSLAAYVLIGLQTRSGIIYFSFGLAVTVLIVLKDKALSSMRILTVVSMCAVLTSIAFGPKILEYSNSLVTRFSIDHDPASAGGRLYSFLFLFKIVWNPLYWIPQGAEGFIGVGKAGKLPLAHSNLTAMFLESGILGLISWLILWVYALFGLAKAYWLDHADSVTGFGFAACTMVFLIQLSLSVTTTDQVWLWLGVGWGCLHRHQKFN